MRAGARDGTVEGMEMLDGPDAGRRDLDGATLRRRAGRGEIRRVRPGSFAQQAPGSPESEHLLLLRATAPHLGPHTVVSHETAALVHGLPLLRARLGRVTVLRTRGNGAISRHLHARTAGLATHEVDEREGFRVTSLERTVRDLACTLPFGEALAAADAAARRGAGLAAISPAGRSHRRIARIRDEADGRAESIAESMSRAIMLEAGLPRPELQLEIFDGAGGFVARTDFAWPELRVVGEFDGAVKYTGALGGSASPGAAILAEKRREWRIRELGWSIVRWDWQTLATAGALEARLARALRAPPATAG